MKERVENIKRPIETLFAEKREDEKKIEEIKIELKAVLHL